MLPSPWTIIRIIIIVKWIPHSLSWSSQTVFEADQLYRTLESVSFHRLRRPQPKPMAVAPPMNGHSPLGANVRVGHASFIHGDGRHFASSRAISESIKKAINFERTKRKKMLVLLITVAGSQTQTNHSRIGSIYQRCIQRALSRLQQNPFPHMAALKITAGDTLPRILRLQMRSTKRITNIFIYLFWGWMI